MSGWFSGKQKVPEVSAEAVPASGDADSARKLAATYLLEPAYPKDTILIIADRSEFLFKIGNKVVVGRGTQSEETKTIIALEDTNIHFDSPLTYPHVAGSTVDQLSVARGGATKGVGCFPCFPPSSRGPTIAPMQQSNRGPVVDNGKSPDEDEKIASLTRQLEQEKARLKVLEEKVFVNGPMKTEDATVIAPIKTRDVVVRAPIKAEDAAVYASNNTEDASSNDAASWWILPSLWSNDEPVQNKQDHQPAQARSMVPSIWASDEPVEDQEDLQQSTNIPMSNELVQDQKDHDQSGLAQPMAPGSTLFGEGVNEELASTFEKLDAELNKLRSRNEEPEAIVERSCEPQSESNLYNEPSTSSNGELRLLKEQLAQARVQLSLTLDQCQSYATDNQQLQDRHDALEQELQKLKNAVDTVEDARQIEDLQGRISSQEIQELREQLADARGLLVQTQEQCENYATSHRELQVKHDSLDDELQRVQQMMVQKPSQDGELEDLRQRIIYLEGANKAIREQAEDREIEASERVKQLELERDELTRQIGQHDNDRAFLENHINEMEARRLEEIAKIEAECRDHLDEMQRRHEERTANYMGSVSPDELELFKDEFRQMKEKYQQHIQVLEAELQRCASLQVQEDERLLRIQELEGDLELLRDEAERALSGKDIELQEKSLMLDMHQREFAATHAQLESIQQQSFEQAQHIEALGLQLQSSSFGGENNESTSEDKELILQLSEENASLKEQLASTWAQINAQMVHLEDERQHYLQDSNGPLNREVAYPPYNGGNAQPEFETVPSEVRPCFLLQPGVVDGGPVENRSWVQPLAYTASVEQVQAQPVLMTSSISGAPQPVRRFVDGGSMNLPSSQRGSMDGLDFQTYTSGTPRTMPVVTQPAQPGWTFGSNQMVHAKTLATVPIEASSLSSPAQAPYPVSMRSPQPSGVVTVSETMPCRSSLDVGPHIIMRPPNTVSEPTPCRSSLDAGPQITLGPPNTFPSATLSRSSFDVGPQITTRPQSMAWENAPCRSSFDDSSLTPLSADRIHSV